MCTDDIGYDENVGSMFCYMVEGRNDASESWVTLSCLQDKRSANRRLADLHDGPYKDLRIVRRAFL